MEPQTDRPGVAAAALPPAATGFVDSGGTLHRWRAFLDLVAALPPEALTVQLRAATEDEKKPCRCQFTPFLMRLYLLPVASEPKAYTVAAGEAAESPLEAQKSLWFIPRLGDVELHPALVPVLERWLALVPGEEAAIRRNVALGGAWAVKTADGAVREYHSLDVLRESILEGRIRPDDTAALVCKPDGKAEKAPKWLPVHAGLGRKTYVLQRLFQPVWARSCEGGALAALIGAALYTLASAVGALFLGWVAVAYFLAVGSLLWILPMAFDVICGDGEFPVLRKFVRFTRSAKVWIGVAVVAAWLAKDYPIWKSLAFVASGFFAAAAAGALLGVFPGMVAGTVVGLARRRGSPASPHAAPEDEIMWKGVVLPVVGFIVVLAAWMVLNHWLVSWYAQHPLEL